MTRILCKSAPLILTVLALGFGRFIACEVLKTIPLKPEPAYAVLAVDASLPDRFVRERLPENLAGISESTQWVLLDDFGTLEQIPLDRYEGRLEAFDPRNDGYAEKLRSFFIRGEKRLFFIPLPSVFWGTIPVSDTWLNKKRAERLETELQDALGDIPFSIDFFGNEQPVLAYFSLFALAALGALILSDKPLFTGALLPVLGALVCAGPAGFAADALILGAAGGGMTLLKKKRPDAKAGQKYALYLLVLGLWAGAFLALPGIFSPAGEGMPGRADWNAVRALSVSALFAAGVLVLAFAGADIHSGRRLPRAAEGQRVLDVSAVPFILVSLMALPYSPSQETSFSADGVDAADYEAHRAFQSSFSFTPLGRDAAGNRATPYRRYVLGADGLITSVEDLYPSETSAAPEFPLTDLIAFFKNFRHTAVEKPGLDWKLTVCSMSPLLLVLAEGVMVQKRGPRRKKKQRAEYYEKRMAA